MTTPTTHRPTWLTATKTLIQAHLRLAVWFWAVLALILVGAHVLMSGVIPTRVLIAQYGTHGSTWFPFTLAIIFVLAYLPVHVTSGMTRRSFIRANLATALLMGPAYGAGLFLLAAVERTVFPEAPVPFDQQQVFGSSGLWGLLVGQALLSTTGIVCGLLVGIAYYRLHALLATLLLIPTVGPVLVVVALTASDAPIQQWLGLPTGTGWAVGAAAVVIALAALAFHLITRTIPIKAVE
ncbi:MAG TPA: hypothetical protein VK063_06260 [Beutenbergiaceae bacterium]|nr:hypothetical protein [Beutenbergiaceae bacterium]